jgi:hypothetical protein
VTISRFEIKWFKEISGYVPHAQLNLTERLSTHDTITIPPSWVYLSGKRQHGDGCLCDIKKKRGQRKKSYTRAHMHTDTYTGTRRRTQAEICVRKVLFNWSVHYKHFSYVFCILLIVTVHTNTHTEHSTTRLNFNSFTHTLSLLPKIIFWIHWTKKGKIKLRNTFVCTFACAHY